MAGRRGAETECFMKHSFICVSGRPCHKCFSQMSGFSAVQEVASEIKGMIEDFRPYIPLIQGLRNPGMRNRHWEQVRLLCFSGLMHVTFVSVFSEE